MLFSPARNPLSVPSHNDVTLRFLEFLSTGRTVLEQGPALPEKLRVCHLNQDKFPFLTFRVAYHEGGSFDGSSLPKVLPTSNLLSFQSTIQEAGDGRRERGLGYLVVILEGGEEGNCQSWELAQTGPAVGGGRGWDPLLVAAGSQWALFFCGVY